MRLIPDQIVSNCTASEKKVFKLLQATNLPGWCAFHSYNLKQHLSKREGEIDFLVLGPPGLFVLEVKGGQVRRQSGRWYYGYKNRGYSKQESPFAQARSAMYSLRDDLQHKYNLDTRRRLFGYGVVVPDSDFEVSSPEWDERIVADKTSLKDSDLSTYLTGLATYWQQRSRSGQVLTKAELRGLVNCLRGDFDPLTAFGWSLISKQESDRLTDDQLEFLGQIDDNERIVLSGPAGSGKTVMALTMMANYSQQGLRPVFLCYNRLLAVSLAQAHPDWEIDTIHGLLRSRLKVSDDEISHHPDKNHLFDVDWPKRFLQLPTVEPYGALVVDEAQDAITKSHLPVLNRLVAGGLKRGRWLMALDMNQAIYSSGSVEAEAALAELKTKGTLIKLQANCRNTGNIIKATRELTGLDYEAKADIPGIPVRYLWYKDQEEQLAKVSQCLTSLQKTGFKPSDIVVLSPRAKNSLARSGLATDHSLYKLDAQSLGRRPDRIGYATIQAFKGLESLVVVLTDIEDLDGRRALNYVGLTRARAVLVVAAHRRLKPKPFGRKKPLKGPGS